MTRNITPTPKTISSKKITLVTASLLLSGMLVACGNKPENPTVGNTTNTAEKEVPMSAKPADTKGKPVAIGEEDKAEKGSVVTSDTASTNAPVHASSSTNSTNNVVPVVADSSVAAIAEGGADNSGMDKISENDQVIDDAPASPDAPKAPEENTQISNSPTKHKKP